MKIKGIGRKCAVHRDRTKYHRPDNKVELPDVTCHVGKHTPEDPAIWIYTLNPEGGYGRPELRICSECLQKPENKWAKDRLLETTTFTEKELEEIHGKDQAEN